LTIRDGVIRIPSLAQFALNPAAATAHPNIAFASMWDNYPAAVNVSVPAASATGAKAVWVLVSGSTNPMQTKLVNAILRFRYADGSNEELELTPPANFWSMCEWGGADYDYTRDAFCLPEIPPVTVQLGSSNRAMVYSWDLKEGAVLAAVELEVYSQEVVIGLVAVSLAH
jgi:hypothetical protein